MRYASPYYVGLFLSTVIVVLTSVTCFTTTSSTKLAFEQARRWHQRPVIHPTQATSARQQQYDWRSNVTHKMTASSAVTSSSSTLTDATTWRLSFVLRNVATTQGKKVDEILVVNGQFVEEDGYEPPQGSFVQVNNKNNNNSTTNNVSNNGRDANSRLQIVKSRWMLSEDPNDRKDGLWVWGLFKEPLYPFMLLQLETNAIPVAGSGGDDCIPPLQLYAQINHKRKGGMVLLEAAELKVRLVESIKADPFGVSKVDVYEEVTVGSLSIQVAATR